MNTLSLPASKARTNFFDLLDRIEQYGQILITRYGKIKAILVNPEEFEGLEETREVLAIPGILEAIKKSKEDFKKGRFATFEEVVGKTPREILKEKKRV